MMPQALTGLAGELGFKRRDNPLEYGRAWNKRNREKLNAYHRDYYHDVVKNDPKKLKSKLASGSKSRRLRKYNMTNEEFEQRLAQQEGKCYICGVHKGHDLRVDHDHETGKNRKLLCANCNAAIGLMGEDGDRLRAAADYVEQHH
jgi:Recombination endonuclease VII